MTRLKNSKQQPLWKITWTHILDLRGIRVQNPSFHKSQILSEINSNDVLMHVNTSSKLISRKICKLWKHGFGTLVSLRSRICDQVIFHSNYRFQFFRNDLTNVFLLFFRLGEKEGSMPVSWTFLNPTTLVTKMKRFNFPELEIFDEWMKSVSVNFFVKLFIMPHRAFLTDFFIISNLEIELN